MTKKEVFLKLSNKIKEQLNNNEVDIQLSSKINEIGLNSIDFIKLLVFVEDEFEFEFDDDDLLMEKYQVVEDMVDLIYSNILKSNQR